MAGEGVSVAGGCDAEAPTEVSVEVALVGEPGEDGDSGGRGACFEEASSAHDSLADLEGVGRDAGDGSELSNELELGGARGVREVVERRVHAAGVLQVSRRYANGTTAE